MALSPANTSFLTAEPIPASSEHRLDASAQAYLPCTTPTLILPLLGNNIFIQTEILDSQSMYGQDIIRCNRCEARRVSRRDAILEVAQSNFMQRGYAGTSMSAIARTLGGSKGTLWAYFPSKEVLFSAVADRASQSFRDEISFILNRDEKIELVLYRFTHHFLEKITSAETIALNRLVIGEVKNFPETGQIYYSRVIASIHELLADYFSTATERGLLRGTDPLTAAQHLVGLCIGGCHRQIVLGLISSPDPSQIQQEAKNAAEAILRAYTNLY